MQVQNALGKYAHAVTAGVVALVLAAWAIVQVGVAFGVTVGKPDQLDMFALAAFTYLLGNVSAINGVRPEVLAAHRRLDAVGAPAADAAAHILEAGTGGPGQQQTHNGMAVAHRHDEPKGGVRG